MFDLEKKSYITFFDLDKDEDDNNSDEYDFYNELRFYSCKFSGDG